jgi:hypothetical protein
MPILVPLQGSFPFGVLNQGYIAKGRRQARKSSTGIPWDPLIMVRYGACVFFAQIEIEPGL